MFVKILIFFIAKTGHISQCSTYLMLLLTLGTTLQHQLQLIVAATMLLPLLMTSLSKPMIAFVFVFIWFIILKSKLSRGVRLGRVSQPTGSPKNGGNNFFCPFAVCSGVLLCVSLGAVSRLRMPIPANRHPSRPSRLRRFPQTSTPQSKRDNIHGPIQPIAKHPTMISS